jgi:hypothetical protein
LLDVPRLLASLREQASEPRKIPSAGRLQHVLDVRINLSFGVAEQEAFEALEAARSTHPWLLHLAAR